MGTCTLCDKGVQRRTPGGRKLWESKDDRKWGHDKFEEMNLQETHYEGERRKSKGHYRGHGKNRGVDHGNARGSRSRGYGNGNNQNNSSKSVRGRGPRRYEPPANYNSEPPTNQNKQSGKVAETTSNASSGRVHMNTKNVQSDRVPPRKNVFASSLNSASPPFYPSSSSNQDVSVPQKRNAHSGNANRNLSPSGMDDNYSAPHSNSYRGKSVANPVGLDRLYVGESVRPVSGKQLSNLQLHASGTSSIMTTQSPQSRAQGRGLAVSGQLSYHPTLPLNQVNRVSAEAHPSSVQPRPVQIPAQPLRASTQHLGQRPGTGSQASSPPKAPSRNSPEPGESESPPSSSKSKTALVGKGKGNVQGSGRGSFLYNGAQVIGATGTMGVAHGDQNFPGSPALLPVMQFRGQHPGGLGVPAVGMALPGYVAQPQLGFGNSEMTWVPVLAGAAAAGALGASYCSPYVAVDGGYYARQSGQTSSLGSSGKETSSNKPNNGWKPPQKPELVNDEFGQRQNKPRRYSEMNFGQ
ncbi:protein MLN51 homolog [Macadamia integrifolia]|uniref:protein MLN51 homolog n=1 Tax=Macadamia integrifolia TaxID=60698 RepID=UPI001C5277E4|nr:protein MLN51 homolog [Macadamia integrifolia]